jgi:hypothetical protein
VKAEGVHRGCSCHRLVAIEALRPDGRGMGLEGPSATWAIPLRQSVEDSFDLHWVTFQYSMAVDPVVLQEHVAVGAAVACRGLDVHDPLCLAGVKGPAANPAVP